MKTNQTLLAALLASAFMVTVSACDQDGPMENAGEEVDESVEETGDAIENATDGD